MIDQTLKDLDLNNLNNPYDIFKKGNNVEKIKTVVIDSFANKTKKPIFDFVTQGDPVFGINDVALTGLLMYWMKRARRKTSEVLKILIEQYKGQPTIKIEEGLSSVIILCIPYISYVSYRWFNQLQNPIRGRVVYTFINNIPKSIKERKSIFECAGEDFFKEQNQTNNYFFQEINKTMLAYLVLTCYSSSIEIEPIINEMIANGYKWFNAPPVNGYSPEDLAEFLFMDIPFPHVFSAESYGKGLYNAESTIREMDAEYNNALLKPHYVYLKRNSKDFIEAFSKLDSYPF